MSSHQTTTITKNDPPVPIDIKAAAEEASALLDRIAAILPFDEPSARDAKLAIAASRVPTEAISIASEFLKANPGRLAAAEAAIHNGVGSAPSEHTVVTAPSAGTANH